MLEYEGKLAELQAYRIERSLGTGEGYAASAIGSVLHIAQDGKTGTVVLNNNVESGNSIVFELTLDEEIIYTSSPIRPGESLENFELEQALETGSYTAVAIQKTYAADGTYVSGIRVPVTLIVD